MTGDAGAERAPAPPPPGPTASPAAPAADAPAAPAARTPGVFLVSYDLVAAHHDDDYERVEERIRSLGRTARILDAQFLVQSDRTAAGVADHVAAALGAGDHLFVTAVSDDMAWRRLAMGERRGRRWRHAARAR